MATHSSVLAWRIPGTGKPGGCRLWGRTESDTTEATQQQQQQVQRPGVRVEVNPIQTEGVIFPKENKCCLKGEGGMNAG